MNYRFSGHETFPFRYTWLPKAVQVIGVDHRLLEDDEQAMVELGVGKNMVRAIRFWIQVSGLATYSRQDGYIVTPLGESLLGASGLDPYLEDVRTLWLIHWNLSSQREDPLFAWDHLLNHWHHPDFTRTDVLLAFRREAARLERDLSDVTLEQHFDIFLHTYVPTRGGKGLILEDNLDCPLVELNLIRKIGERRVGGQGKQEAVYAFQRDPKPDISAELFAYCLHEFWDTYHPHEDVLSFRDVAVAVGSPGQIFKLPEWDIRERLETIHEDSHGAFRYEESAAFQQIGRLAHEHGDLLPMIYSLEAPHA